LLVVRAGVLKGTTCFASIAQESKWQACQTTTLAKTCRGHHMATTWQTHGKHIATTWQPHGNNMANAWQNIGKYMAITWQIHGNTYAHIYLGLQKSWHRYFA
jgi:hypothetical protein